jgi:hypothetical protein
MASPKKLDNSQSHMISSSCGTKNGTGWRRAMISWAVMDARRTFIAGLLPALGIGTSIAVLPAIRADQGDDAAAAAQERAIRMERYVVSATRIEKNPWRYASVPGFEILSRASEDDTNWLLNALQCGFWLENGVLPKDWRPESPIPYTLIIDDTNLKTVPTGQIHLLPITFKSPVDAITWGPMSDVQMWIDRFQAQDADTFALNSNLYDVDTRTAAYGTISLERLFRCAPPLPRWLIVGLMGKDCGVFRESFAPFGEGYYEIGHFERDRAIGPGTLWVSLDETRVLRTQIDGAYARYGRPKMKWSPKLHMTVPETIDRAPPIEIPPLQGLFSETPPPGEKIRLWESEAALFVRWGLMGPGHEDPTMSKAFLEFVRRARREPVTEKVFADCFGFGYSDMEYGLEVLLKGVLAKPTSVYVAFPSSFPEARLKEATADQIGRILGDWLRMQGDSLRAKDPELSAKILYLAGRMLERAYREDNGLPPDVEPYPGGEQSAISPQNAAYGPAVAMKPFVVTANRIHDPSLLAVYGLYEHDIGNDGKAREFLEAAVKAGATRPRAYLVLAELRYAEAIAKPLGTEGKLNALQAATILEPLRTTLQYPPVFDSYRLLVDTSARCEAKPASSDVEKVVEGVALFPRNVDLAYRSAAVCAQGGYPMQAAELIDKGLIFTTDKDEKQHFERLRSAMATPAASLAR